MITCLCFNLIDYVKYYVIPYELPNVTAFKSFVKKQKEI